MDGSSLFFGLLVVWFGMEKIRLLVADVDLKSVYKKIHTCPTLEISTRCKLHTVDDVHGCIKKNK